MTQMYCALLRKYHGEAQGVMTIDPAYCIEWAFVPHFFYNFYVYQYATSMAGAAEFTDRIVKDGAPRRERLPRHAEGGRHRIIPMSIYKDAGIDMATPRPTRR